ncbi:MAG: hypothetical protein N3G20_01970, partial [Verrucomicrobiae bacterium]|nr:hypothetical protein [Verrucomicrobiae bacterium]
MSSRPDTIDIDQQRYIQGKPSWRWSALQRPGNHGFPCTIRNLAKKTIRGCTSARGTSVLIKGNFNSHVNARPLTHFAISILLGCSGTAAQTLRPIVEVEETVYQFQPANNGAGPMWCHGSTCIVRVKDRVVASGLETLTKLPPLNNCRWTLWQKEIGQWQQACSDPAGRTREPCPLAVLPKENHVFLSSNPTLEPAGKPGGGPARPEIWRFRLPDLAKPEAVITPEWDGSPGFTEHSYRSFAADGTAGELILFQNIGYTHAEYCCMDNSGRRIASGKLKWPWGAEYDTPQPIRVCYPNVALVNRSVHFVGISDIVEPYRAWREF